MDSKSEKKELDTRDVVRTVTSNSFITAVGLERMSLKARKLLYIAISQCKMNDDQFYEYEISVPEFAKLMGLKSNSNIYREADSVTDELMQTLIKIPYAINSKNKKFKKYTVFSVCDYDSGSISFKINTDMTDLFLDLKKDFTQPLLTDFLHMNSTYSMSIWHLMQREMKSHKPSITDVMEFELSLEELRVVTSTTNKFKQVGQFKEKVLDKAIREILDNCGVKVTYQNIKVGRSIVGFKFKAVSVIHMDEDQILDRIKDKVGKIKKHQNTL